MPYATDTADNGMVFYLYPVQKSEGWYRISKTFDIKQDTLFKYNPKEQKEGLHFGDTILIPFCRVQPAVDSTEYIVHELQPKETLYGISKKYKVSQKDILKLNPVTGVQMQIGQRLLIPVNRRNSKFLEDAKENGNEVSGVSDNGSLVRRNTLVESPVRMDSTVKRPVGADTLNRVQILRDTVRLEVTPVIHDSSTLLPQADFHPTDLPIRLAVLLPLQAEQVKRDEQLDRFTDFYEGLLLAVYQMQQHGQKFEIYTYDTGKGAEKIPYILSQPELRNADAIIGPAFPSQVKQVSAYSLQNKILTIVPFTSQVPSLTTNPYLMQFSASNLTEAETLSRYLKQRADSVQVVVFDQAKEDIPQSVLTLRSVLAADSVNMVHTTLHNVLADSLTAVLDSTKENLFVFNTERYANVELVMPKLVELQSRFKLRLYSRFSWQDEPIEIHQCYTSVFAKEPDTVQLAVYEQLLSRFFKSGIVSSNPRFDLLGFDLMRYVTLLLQRDQTTDFALEVENIVLQGLQSDIQMKRVSPVGGFVNSKISLIEK